MKKLISFVMAAVLCVGMTTVVMAAEYPSATTEGITEAGIVDSVVSEAGEVVVAPVDKDATEYAGVTFEAKEVIKVAPSLEGVKVNSMSLLDINVNGAPAGEEVVVTLKCEKVLGNVAAFHYCDTHDKWEVMPISVNGKEISLTFNCGFSPVMIVEYAPVASGSVNEDVSPKTADVAMFGLYAAVALAGTVTAARKAKESK